MATETNGNPAPSDVDLRFVERQIRVHVELAQWKPDAHVEATTPDCWRRAFAMAHLQREGIADSAELGRRLSASESEIDEDRRLIPYLDRTIAGLLGMLGWYVDSQV